MGERWKRAEARKVAEHGERVVNKLHDLAVEEAPEHDHTGRLHENQHYCGAFWVKVRAPNGKFVEGWGTSREAAYDNLIQRLTQIRR